MALATATAMPNQRPISPPRQIEYAASSCATPSNSMIQPHVFRLLRMYVAFSVKMRESPIEATPKMTLRTPARKTMIPPNSTQLPPCGDRSGAASPGRYARPDRGVVSVIAYSLSLGGLPFDHAPAASATQWGGHQS